MIPSSPKTTLSAIVSEGDLLHAARYCVQNGVSGAFVIHCLVPRLIDSLVVALLADLFVKMEFEEAAAVTPALELAKLALVTSQDEEEEGDVRAGTDSSNDTDATLVEDGPARFASPALVEPSSTAVTPGGTPGPSSTAATPGAGSPGSVLGKRKGSEMDVDMKEDYVVVSKPSSPAPGPSRAVMDKDNDVEMQSVAEPPPVRPAAVKRKTGAQTGESTMMFG